jgi:hypothetical protein
MVRNIVVDETSLNSRTLFGKWIWDKYFWNLAKLKIQISERMEEEPRSDCNKKRCLCLMVTQQNMIQRLE